MKLRLNRAFKIDRRPDPKIRTAGSAILQVELDRPGWQFNKQMRMTVSAHHPMIDM